MKRVRSKSPVQPTKAKQIERIVLANWGRRLIAWLVDYLIVNVMIAYLGVEQLEDSLLPTTLLPSLPGLGLSIWSPFSILIFFAYWTLLEWYFGRSIGQLLLNVRLVNLRGEPASLKASAIQSIGKSLVLPFDCLIGWASKDCRSRRQRFSNKLSKTIVVYVGSPDHAIQGAEFAKEP